MKLIHLSDLHIGKKLNLCAFLFSQSICRVSTDSQLVCNTVAINGRTGRIKIDELTVKIVIHQDGKTDVAKYYIVGSDESTEIPFNA